MSDIVIFGAGQLASVISVYIARESSHRIVGYTVDDSYLGGSSTFNGLPLVAWERLEEHFATDRVLLLGPVSYRDANRFRRDRYLDGKARGYDFASFIHPATHIYSDRIGENCIILEGNVVQPFAEVGNNCILWSGNHVGHHTIIGNHCFLASQVGIGGNARIGERTFFGGQSGVIDNTSIGEGCIIGAGSTVLNDLGDESFVMFRGTRTLEGAAGRFASTLLG
ncbi:acetyltransferase [Breoghania sp. L-A4]|uniref:acetyltransferase n=1 Tax=Breoghania sp. L-A4 TaxID=2304600 RepID=UPI0013C302B2|nr:acetyltransferase [Breoghania sp. L-A4]